MDWLRNLFNKKSKDTELSRVKKMTTRKLVLPDVGGGYYIRFHAEKKKGSWRVNYETNCDFDTEGKKKSLNAFREAQTAHKSKNDGHLYVETVMMILADLEEAHLAYTQGSKPIEQDQKQMLDHYAVVFEKMPEGMQESINDRWGEYSSEKPDILPKKEARALGTDIKRALPGKRPGTSH